MSFLNYTQAEMETIHIVSIIAINLTLIFSIIVILLTLREWQISRKTKHSMSIVRWFPFFVSIGHVIFGIFHQTDHIYSLIHSHIPTESLCTVLAFFTGFGFLTSMAWVLTSCVFLYFMLYDNVPYFGRWNLRLFLINMFVPILFSLLPFAFEGGYGNTYNLFCYSENRGWTIFANIITPFGMFALIVFFSGLCVNKLKYTVPNATLKQNDHFVRGLGGFVLLYGFNYLFYAITFSLLVSGTIVSFWIMAIAMFAINCGGLFNFIIYFYIYRYGFTVSDEEFDIVLTDVQLSQKVYLFAQKSLCEENIAFLLRLKNLYTSNSSLNDLSEIMKTFVYPDSTMELNLTAPIRQKTIDNYEKLIIANDVGESVSNYQCCECLDDCKDEVTFLVKRNILDDFLSKRKNRKLFNARLEQRQHMRSVGLSATATQSRVSSDLESSSQGFQKINVHSEFTLTNSNPSIMGSGDKFALSQYSQDSFASIVNSHKNPDFGKHRPNSEKMNQVLKTNHPHPIDKSHNDNNQEGAMGKSNDSLRSIIKPQLLTKSSTLTHSTSNDSLTQEVD